MQKPLSSTFLSTLVLVLPMLLASCGSEPAQQETGESPGTNEPAETGDSTDPQTEEPPDWSTQSNRPEFYGYFCRGCHGDDGTGSRNGPQIRHLDPEYARWVVRNGRYNRWSASMPVFNSSEVSDEELDDIVAWLRGFQKPTSGESLYGVYCSHCHGTSGRGGKVEVDITNVLTTPSLVVDTIRNGAGGTDYRKRSDYMPARSTTELSDEQAQSIVDYLQDLNGIQ